MSVNTPLIEPDADTDILPPPVTQSRSPNPNHLSSASSAQQESTGVAQIFRQSSHPLALLMLYLFRIAAILVYILCGFFTENYVLSTVVVVVLLAADFYNTRNVAGRTLVGLRFWNQVDDDGESYWVFESRDPARGAANKVDEKMFWIALYVFPCLWSALLIVSFLKLSISFIPIVILALVFNLTNAIGFTYADRDAKQRWANNLSSSFMGGFGGIGGNLLAGAVKSGVGRMFK
ncbi:Golgi apparatus membrane protein TVP23 [Hymenopellis radicata]|nr:Golgi apparatus membrane protein TVP23 [Hymenopellis radicata]